MTTNQQLPQAASRALLEDAKKRDIVSARRDALLNILWFERYLSREQLIARVNLSLGKSCFGKKAWKDAFYRDMRFVKSAFKKAGYNLKYSRDPQFSGYYLAGEPTLHPLLAEEIFAALDELDPQQIAIYQRISPAQKFFQAASMIDLSRRVAHGRAD